jgi:hypothetical protein
MGIVGILVLWNATRVIAADTSGATPYQGIVERNVFGLKPPPPPPDPEANKPPPPRIILQGITTFMGSKRALIKVQMPARPPDPAKEVPLILSEGQRDGDIEILEINDKPGNEFVKVNDFGTITNLNFENNGIKTAGTPAPGGPPGPAGFVPPPGSLPAGKPFPAALPTTRPMRLPPTGASASPGGYGGTVSPASYGGMPAPNAYSAVSATPTYNSAAGTVTLPSFTATTPMPNQTAAQQQQQAPLSADASTALMMAQHLQNKDNPMFPPAPPPIAQMLGEGDNSAPPTPAAPARRTPPRAPGMPLLPPQMPQ